MLTFLEFAIEMGVASHHIRHHREEAMDHAAKIVEREAKEAIGTYKYGWPALADSTLEKKGADTPLLETGALRDSIEHKVHHTARGSDADIGTNDEKAAWQEFGTAKIPPRPFMGGALAAKEHEVEKLFDGIFSKSFRSR